MNALVILCVFIEIKNDLYVCIYGNVCVCVCGVGGSPS